MKNLAKDHPKIGSMVKIFPTVSDFLQNPYFNGHLNYDHFFQKKDTFYFGTSLPLARKNQMR